MKPDLVQLRNPRSDRFVKVDRTRGVIVSTKASPGPYAGVPVIASTKRRRTSR